MKNKEIVKSGDFSLGACPPSIRHLYPEHLSTEEIRLKDAEFPSFPNFNDLLSGLLNNRKIDIVHGPHSTS